MKLLLTAGATRERIDGVRFISNISSGATGALVASYLSRQAHDVTFVHGKGAVLPEGKIRLVAFESFEDLNNTLRALLSEEHYDAIIHSAAVSDFSVQSITVDGHELAPSEIAKIDSTQNVQIQLAHNFKIIDRLKMYSRNNSVRVIGFKLTNTLDPAMRTKAIQTLSLKPEIDYVVHNDLSEISASRHLSRIFRKECLLFSGETKQDLALNLDRLLKEAP